MIYIVRLLLCGECIAEDGNRMGVPVAYMQQYIMKADIGAVEIKRSG